MKVLGKIEDQKVVLEFLRAELASPRFSPILKDALSSLGLKQEIITNPDLSDSNQNRSRELILGKYRGWKQNQFIFNNFPSDVQWYNVELSLDEIKQLQYINYSYWIKLSSGTKKVADAAKNINDGKEFLGESNQRFLETAEEIKSGMQFAEIILVSDSLNGNITILEGHLRSTAFALAGEPNRITAILGVSPGIKRWTENSFG